MEAPRMLRLSEIDTILRAARSAANLRLLKGNKTPQAERAIVAPGRSHSIPVTPTGQVRKVRTVQSGSGTGINPWWLYQEEALAGGGRVMANIGTGNVVLQDDDMTVPHKGIALAFRRTYNSQSLHDVAGDDGAARSIYGNGWTNTFDAHLSGDPQTGTLTVWDIDGARYDYTGSDAAGWSPPAGQYATLTFDVSCGYLWTKKNGTTYYFFETAEHPATCPYPFAHYGSYSGTLYQIIGRNRNTVLTFRYSWDTDASPTGKISGISVQTESGMIATMTFADIAGHRLLQQLTFPDGVTSVGYGYDATGNLTSVSYPPNNAAGIRPQVTYGYQSLGAGSVLWWVYSPRLNGSEPFGSDGGFTAFVYAGTNQATSTLSETARKAVINPSIADSSSQPSLQPNYPSLFYYLHEYYTIGGSQATFRDSDGHAKNWVMDSRGRPTQTQECTITSYQTCTGAYLVTNENWDDANNKISQVDSRLNETDYAYDRNGNTIAIAEPAPEPGAFRPTSLFSYDVDPNGAVTSNVVAYCDPVATHRIAADWQSAPAPSDALCPRSTVATQYIYSYPASQPNGRLEQIVTPATMAAPSGYHTTFSYAAAQQGGEYDLPTQLRGDTMSQPDSSVPTRQPSQNYWYDTNGQIVCFQTGNGAWLIAHDLLERITQATDPDDGIVSSNSCSKTGGLPGWDTSTRFTYYPDGSKATAQTPAQRAFGVSTQYTYDLDGDTTGETHAFACTAAPCATTTTTKYYDGADRLVEVVLPSGPGDAWGPWMTRYIYDLSQGGTTSIPGGTLTGHGNLVATQEYLPVDVSTPPWSWKPLKGSSYDALDRRVADYGFAPGQSNAYATTYAYDGNGQMGLLSSRLDALHQTTLYSYDFIGRTTAIQYQNVLSPTYSKQFTFDADGRTITAASGLFGTQTNVYDWNGSLLRRSIPAYAQIPATTLSYDYYADGSKRDLVATLAAFSQSTPLETWSYRPDGRRASTMINYANNAYKLSESYTSAGRLQTATDDFATSTRSYDANGQETTRAFPAGTFSNLKHDPEGMLTSYVGYQNYFPPSGTTVTNVLTVRGELLSQRFSPDYAADHQPLTPAQTPKNYNGYIDGGSNANVNIWDDRTKTPLTQYGPPGDTGQAYTYDASGRLVSSTDTWTGWNSNGSEISRGGSFTKTYDAENHLVAESLNNYNLPGTKGCPGDPNPVSPPGPNWPTTTTGSYSYSWNVDEHPWIVDGTGLIWNGDQPFISMNGSSIATIRIDTRAVLKPGVANPLAIVDRDWSGEAVSSHDVTGHGGMALPGLGMDQPICATPTPGGTSTWGAGALADSVSTPRTDGIVDAINVIQGVRSYDAAVGSWTTPDPFKGVLHDPMSQQPYMWNRNNPYEYSDPTGFDPNPIMLPDEVWHAPSGIKPSNANPWAKSTQDLILSQFVVGVGVTTGLGVLVDNGVRATLTGTKWITKGFIVATAATAAYTLLTDKGIAPGYYAQTVFRADGTATTYSVYKPGESGEGSLAGFIQYVDFDRNGNWTARTIFEDGALLQQRGFSWRAHTIHDVSDFQMPSDVPYAVPAAVGAKG